MEYFQIAVFILLTSSLNLLIATSFTIIYQSAKFFHFAHAIFITIGPYFTYLFSIQLNIKLWIAIPISILCSVILAFLMEISIYKPLRKMKTSSWNLLIASLGIYVVLQNVISILWGDNTKCIRTWPVTKGQSIFGAYITDAQIVIIAVSIILFIFILLFLRFIPFGKQIRAVSSNEELSNIFGISSDMIILWSFIIGSALAAIAGNLISIDTDMTPTMGFKVLLYGVIVMIIGGVGSYKGIVGGALLLATAQHLSAYYIGGKWMDLTVFIILISFLIWKPFGFSGKRLKKIEI